MGKKLEALRGKLREIWPYLAAVVFLLVAGATLIDLPETAVPKATYWLDTKSIFGIKNEARKTIAYIIGGLLAVIGIILTFRRIRVLERQVQIAQEEQITERFTRAIEQLGSDKVSIRLGGIYALERIANDSDKDYWPIMETLTACVRERAPWREASPISQEKVYGEDPYSTATKPEVTLPVLRRKNSKCTIPSLMKKPDCLIICRSRRPRARNRRGMARNNPRIFHRPEAGATKAL
jgi:hypothetical protein